MALAARADASSFSSLHFGIEVADAETLRQLLDRLSAENLETGELSESDNRVAFHCLDPDGYQVGVFWAAP